jgi:hypothetical protein
VGKGCLGASIALVQNNIGGTSVVIKAKLSRGVVLLIVFTGYFADPLSKLVLVGLVIAWITVPLIAGADFLRHVVPLVAVPGAVIVIYLLQAVFVALTKSSWAWKEYSIYTFNEQGIKDESPAGIRYVNWDNISRWRKWGGHYFIYMIKGSYFLIPESAISPGEASKFETLLNRYIKPQR